MFSGVALSKLAGGKGRMAGKPLLQRYLLPQSLDNVYVETSLSREERKPLLLCEPILSVLHVQALSVILVAALFYSEQKIQCVDLVRAALSLQWCLWREGAQVLAHCMPRIWPSAGASPTPYKSGRESGLVGLYLFVSKKDCLTLDCFCIAEPHAICLQSAVNCSPRRSSDCQCDYCPDGRGAARRSVLLCRARSKSLLSLPKLIYVKPVHICCWLHWFYGFALNGSSWVF